MGHRGKNNKKKILPESSILLEEKLYFPKLTALQFTVKDSSQGIFFVAGRRVRERERMKRGVWGTRAKLQTLKMGESCE